MPVELETDYLVVGAGATGLAFADEIIRSSRRRTLVVVDEHATPGGHWNHAYPFVTLHQPALYYGVNSLPLGRGGDDLVSKAELLGYFTRVVKTLVETGRLIYLPQARYLGDGRVVSLVNPDVEYHIKARHRLVDTTYTRVTVPSVTPPRYDVSPEIKLVPINALAHLEDPPDHYVIVGAGKTGLDAILFLLGKQVDPDRITWIISQDAWFLNRAEIQPNRIADLMTDQLRISAASSTPNDVLLRQEKAGHIMRLDPDVWPTRYRCATITVSELEQLRRIKRVIRKGRVTCIEPDAIHFGEESIPSVSGSLYVDCTADGLARRPPRPIFEPGLITLQPVVMCQPTYSAAVVAKLEIRYDNDQKKNALSRPISHPQNNEDYFPASLATIQNIDDWAVRFGWWTLRSRLSLAAHMSVLSLIRFFFKALRWRRRGLEKLRVLVASQRQAEAVDGAPDLQSPD